MKPHTPRVHLLDVAEPLLTFCNLRVRCGKTIANAEMRFALHEEDLTEHDDLPIATCGECILLPPEREFRRVYIYGIRDRAEVRAYEAYREEAS